MSEALLEATDMNPSPMAELDKQLESIKLFLDYKSGQLFQDALVEVETHVSDIMGTPNEHRMGKLALSEVTWQQIGECRDMDADLFFPERGASLTMAQDICRRCLVREDCLEYALEQNEKFGVWGGVSPTFRRRLKRARFISRRQAS